MKALSDKEQKLLRKLLKEHNEYSRWEPLIIPPKRMVTNMSDDKMVPRNTELLIEQETYSAVRGFIIAAQKQVYTAVNAAMVSAYWNIGKRIYDSCGENERAAYGKQLMSFLAEKLTEEFGKGFSVRNLQMMRQFYVIIYILWQGKGLLVFHLQL